jgi:hypothetical protein
MLLSVGVWLAGQAFAVDTGLVNREYQLKTAYLFHFAELAEWPNSNLMTICLQGSSPLKAYLPILEGQQIDNRAVHVKMIDNESALSCQILFLSENALLSNELKELAKNHHILLVSDAENFARSGGMVQFTLRDNKLKLVVNLPAVKDAGLKLSSKLLRMAEILE